MKRTLIAILALAAVAACNKAEVVEMNQSEAITFEPPFIDNSTKAIDPSHPTVALTSFNVYGTVAHNGNVSNIFNGVEVSKSTSTNQGDAGVGGQFGYATEKTQYWVNGNVYDFAAIAGATASTSDENGMPLTVDYTDTQVDLLYAHNEFGKYDGTSKCVKFAFGHLLSLVKFTFTNGYATATGFKIKVTDVTINNPYLSATCTLATKTWDKHTASTKALTFGNATADNVADNTAAAQLVAGKSACSYNQRLMIPGTYEMLLVSFKVEVLAKDSAGNDFTIDTNEYNDVEVPNVTFTPGYSYNLTANVTEELDAITFSVESIAGWEKGASVTVK
jgi:hypothetical protein